MTSPVIGPPPDKIKTAKDRTKTWLQETYKKELGRDLGDEGEKYWTADIHDRGQTQEQVLANIRRSDEYKNYQRGIGDATPVPLPSPPIHGDPTKPGPKKPKPVKPKPEKQKYDYTPDPNRRYNKYWDAIDAAADTGNRMTDDYYGRFLPQMRNQVLLGINEIGAADRYHGERYEGKPPTYTDPKELFDYYKGKTGKSKDSDSELEKRVKALEDKYSIK
tara:strand:- start:321 stop:977 length:657 start_codon:yes stop_codon:yes gene_type:complete